MLSKGDDYPIHQTPEPIAYAGHDRNFYDRYFFHGYHKEDDIFFAVAMGQYPVLNITDAAFSVLVDGEVHSLFASTILGMERMKTTVGPVHVDVVEPLETLRVVVGPNEHGIEADLTFRRRTIAIEEPRFIRRAGPRTILDYTRLTQLGTWEGIIRIGSKQIDVRRDEFLGTRDRSWGVRPVGLQDPQSVAPPPEPQFYWLWAPLHFENTTSLFHINEDAAGEVWSADAIFCDDAPAETEQMEKARANLVYKPGTRHAKSATLHYLRKDGAKIEIQLKPRYQFYMQSIGYMHPQFSHGRFYGERMLKYESFPIAEA
ncbi:MAG: hypothetical protein R3360_06710, partial [Alphaproteobacteria bacterium]|nr:hypothetical protein [Alphaproteobacteria bacterium]